MTNSQLKHFKQICKPVYRYYKNQLKLLFKHKTDTTATGVDEFLINLKFLRDYYIICTDFMHDDNLAVRVSSLTEALAEYEAASTCIMHYFNFSDKGIPISTLHNLTETEAALKYTAERMQHMNCFWELVKINIENWSVDDV